MDIGEKLKQCRSNTNFTQADIAEKLHLSRKTISGWETGRNYPDINSLIQLSEIYEVPLDDLVRDNRMIKQFNDQKKSRIREDKIIKASYFLNTIFIILEIINMMWPNQYHFFFSPLLSIVNLILFFSHFDNWHRFENSSYTVTAIISFVSIFIMTSTISIINPEIMYQFSEKNDYFLSGIMLSRIFSMLLLTINITVFIFFNKRQR